MVDTAASVIINKRYQIKSQLGVGGMGAVFRAHDRLTGQEVALKRVLTPLGNLQTDKEAGSTQIPTQTDSTLLLTADESANLRLALAQEFRLLASLRHPNIISVLDYGFDDERNPYFTMELLENAKTILEVGQNQSLSLQVNLLVQVLQALAYLHHRGIIHHDMKPGNILVVGDQVKVLDFGISILQERAEVADLALGTLRYIAPEVLQGRPPTGSIDLYSVGVVAYELFTGHPPFHSDNISTLVNNIVTAAPDLTIPGIDPRVVPILMRLLSKSPEDRFSDAIQAIAALGNAIDQPLLAESAATRESYLQAARLVGRDSELAQLSQLLDHACIGRGSGLLIGGESGVGKSRLMDELRIVALAQGVTVLRGGAVREGGSLYQVWRPILRWMTLLTELMPDEASVLKPLVPDIVTLLETDVPEALELDPEAAQTRLLTVIENIFSRQQHPLMIILEDLQWAGSENLSVLARLSRIVRELPIFIIASYRSDEAVDLPSLLPEMDIFKLNRLNAKEIADLSYAILGGAGRQANVVELLQRETEGNVFFVVEVVRALVEAAGRLDLVGKTTLPNRILSGKLQSLVQHRLSSIPDEVRPLLQLAAVLGRQLDLGLLRTFDPGFDLDKWLTMCADFSVLEVQEEEWRFAHDKVREALLAELSEADRRALHTKSAQAIETVYPNQPEQAPILAFHWRMAGNAEKERQYSIQAGEQALQGGAYAEAVTFLSRALELHDHAMTAGQRAYLMRQLANAHYGLGHLVESRNHLYQVLELLNHPLPTTHAGAVKRIPLEMIKHGLYQIAKPSTQKKPDPVLLEAARACERLAQIHYLEHDKISGLLTVLRLLNLGEAIGPSPELARAYVSGALASGIVGLHTLAEAYSRRAEKTAKQAGQPLDVAYVSEVTGIYCAGTCQWKRAEELCRQAADTFQRFGRGRWWEESVLILAIVAYRNGEFLCSSERFKEVYASAHRRGGFESQIWGLSGNLWSLLPLGVIDETLTLLESIPIQHVSTADRICIFTALAEAYLQKGNKAKARELAGQASQLTVQAPPTSQYSFPGYSGLAKVYLTLWEASTGEPAPEREALRKLARQACQSIHGFARVFPTGKPYELLWQGLYDWLNGSQSKALRNWQSCIEIATQQAMPYEQGLAHYEIARHLPPQDPMRGNHLSQAHEIFLRLGASYDLERLKSGFGV